MSEETLKQLETELATLESTQATAATEVTQIEAPTDDFNKCVLWHTWRYGPNGGQGEFRDWRVTEGVRLTKLHDQQLLGRIRELESPSAVAAVGERYSAMMARLLRSKLSHNYKVTPQFRSHWHTFKIIKEP